MPYYCKSLLQVREKLRFQNPGSLNFIIFVCFLCFFCGFFSILPYYALFLFYFILLLFYRYLFSKEREKEMVLIWVGGEWGRFQGNWGEGHSQYILYERKSIFNFKKITMN